MYRGVTCWQAITRGSGADDKRATAKRRYGRRSVIHLRVSRRLLWVVRVDCPTSACSFGSNDITEQYVEAWLALRDCAFRKLDQRLELSAQTHRLQGRGIGIDEFLDDPAALDGQFIHSRPAHGLIAISIGAAPFDDDYVPTECPAEHFTGQIGRLLSCQIIELTGLVARGA